MPTAAAPRIKAPFDAIPDLTTYSRSARDAMAETTAMTVDNLVAYTQAAQQMVGELTALALAGAKDVYALQQEASRSAVNALGESLGKDLTGQPAFKAWEKMVQVGGEVLDRVAEQLRNSVEQGNEKLTDVVDTVAGQMRDGSAKLSSALGNLEKVSAKG